MGPIAVTAENYTLVVALSKLPVAVCVAPRGSAQGRRLFHAAESLGRAMEDDLLVATVDTDDEAARSTAQALGVTEVPALVVVSNGYVIGRTTSVGGEQTLERFAREAIRRIPVNAEAEAQAKAGGRSAERPRRAHWWQRRR